MNYYPPVVKDSLGARWLTIMLIYWAFIMILGRCNDWFEWSLYSNDAYRYITQFTGYIFYVAPAIVVLRSGVAWVKIVGMIMIGLLFISDTAYFIEHELTDETTFFQF